MSNDYFYFKQEDDLNDDLNENDTNNHIDSNNNDDIKF
jgi:hypothetical protein